MMEVREAQTKADQTGAAAVFEFCVTMFASDVTPAPWPTRASTSAR